MASVDEIAIKLGVQSGDLKAALADVDATIQDTTHKGGLSFEALTGAFEHHAIGVRALSTALGTALGLHISEIADKFAELYTGMTKEAEAAYKQLETLSTQAADQAIAEARSRATLEVQYQLALNDRTKTQEKINEINAHSNELTNTQIGLISALINPALALGLLYERRKTSTEAIVELAAKETDLVKQNAEVARLATAEKAKQQEITNILADYDKKELENDLKHADYEERRTILFKQIADAQAKYNADQDGTVQKAKDLLAVQAAQNVAAEAQLKWQEAGRLSLKEQEEEAIIYAQTKQRLSAGEVAQSQTIAELLVSQNNNLSGISEKEHERLNILTLQTDMKKNQRDIDDLLKKGVENLTDAELHKLDILNQQNTADQAQVDAQQKLITGAEEHAANESKVTAELVAQQNAAEATLAAENAWRSISVSGSADFASMSTPALQGLVDRLNKQLNSVGSDGLTLLKNADINSNYADWLTAQQIKEQLNGLSGSGGASGELASRANIQSYASKFGTNAAISQFGDQAVNNALSAQNNVAQNTLNAIKAVGNTLNKVFPGQATPIIGMH